MSAGLIIRTSSTTSIIPIAPAPCPAHPAHAPGVVQVSHPVETAIPIVPEREHHPATITTIMAGRQTTPTAVVSPLMDQVVSAAAGVAAAETSEVAATAVVAQAAADVTDRISHQIKNSVL